MQKPTIIGVGELLWDNLPTGKKLGGAPVNFTYYACALGANGYAVSAIGKDKSGEELLQNFEALGLTSTYIQRNDLPTSEVGVSLDSNGVAQYEIYQNVAWDNIIATSEVCSLAKSTSAICWGSLAQRSVASENAILQIVDCVPENALKIFDINLRQNFYSKEIIENSLNRANVLKLNEDEIVVLSDMFELCGSEIDKAKQLIEKFKLQIVIITMGGDGSVIVSDKSEVSKLKASVSNVVDTVGAGDSFTSTFVASILNGYSLADSHKRANSVASFVCSHEGAIVPRAEIEKFIENL